MDHEKVLQNRASLASDEVSATEGQCCANYLIFALKDKHHEFSLGITTVLECLRFAESQGAIPELPDEWWIAVDGRYDLPSETIIEE
ncbi:hypothetical protein ACYCFK_09485 [Stutzerimonas stutzeri]